MFNGVGTFFKTLIGLGVTLPLALRAYIEYVKFATAKKISDLLSKKDKE